MLLSLFLYHKYSYKVLRTADMVGYGEIKDVRMGDGEYRNFRAVINEKL
nr:MAG TPA: hypothetical protein [Bacteriophage sp.]